MFLKKTLGQHFLRSTSALLKIVEAACLSRGDTVLEVGPGEGVLTEPLLQQAGKVIAVEKDDRLIPILKDKFQNEIAAGKLELIHADILEFSIFNFQFSKKPYKIVANIPYYITGALIRKFLESETQPSAMVLLLQKEVAKRIVAQDGRESILSISVKAYGVPKYIDTVKAGAFSPPPKVDSAIIAIEGISRKFFMDTASYSSFPKGGARRAEDFKSLPASESGTPFMKGRMRGEDLAGREKQFFALLKKGFAHPRKLLASNLGISQEKLRDCGVTEKARPENLSVEDWKCLSISLRDS